MGQTLTHGIYLPVEGERNCYDGLASNWQLLDGAVGTVAEHTSALAGKAADTDVVHKTGNETIAGNKTFTGTTRLSSQEYISANLDVGVTPSSAIGSTLYFSGNNDGQIGYARSVFYQNGVTQTEVAVRNKFSNGALDPNGTYVTATINIGLTDAGDPYITTNGKFRTNLLPSATNAYDLGSSSYQWNNLYAKNYYYNGVAWGLDKSNVWTGANTFASVIQQKINSVYSQTPATDRFAVHEFLGTDGNRIFTLNCADRSSGQREMSLIVYDTDGTFTASGIFKESEGTFSFRPRNNNEINLGTSTNKWKTLNGINPGALGLPSGNYEPINTDGWDLTGATGQSYTPTVHGWLFISIQNIAGNYLSIISGRGAISIDGTGVQGGLRAMLPVIANESVTITVKTGIIYAARFYPCQGNV